MGAPQSVGQAWLVYAASSREDLTLMQMLIDGGADSDHTDNTGRAPLKYAALESDLAMAQMLTDGGANPNRTDKDGLTPLTHAALTSTYKKAQILINGIPDPDNLHRTHTELESNVKVAQTLIDQGADPNHADGDDNKQIPLTHAACSSNFRVATNAA